MDTVSAERIRNALPLLNERQRRLYLANEAKAIGRGGISQVSRVSGVSRVTITQGLKEINAEGYRATETKRCRREGGGRKRVEEKRPEIREKLEEILAPRAKGDPGNPLTWSSKSLRVLEKALREAGYLVSATTIAHLLKSLGYSLQSNGKELAPLSGHFDRTAQFEYINREARRYMEANLPVVSIDAKENIGNFKNGGRERAGKGEAVEALEHDFPIEALGKATPYEVHGLFKNAGFVNVGIGADTAEFAVESLRKWWHEMGAQQYPGADSLYLAADAGGSDGMRLGLWQVKLQELANELGMTLKVSRFPPGTSRWNRIEHRLFSFTGKNRGGGPLPGLAVIVSLIGATATETGLKVQRVIDRHEYRKGVQVSDDVLAKVNLTRDPFHGEWNYEIRPRPK
jgi:transposase